LGDLIKIIVKWNNKIAIPTDKIQDDNFTKNATKLNEFAPFRNCYAHSFDENEIKAKTVPIFSEKSLSNAITAIYFINQYPN
jgi:hypothetical protein